LELAVMYHYNNPLLALRDRNSPTTKLEFGDLEPWTVAASEYFDR
jgi:hypothetical protein